MAVPHPDGRPYPWLNGCGGASADRFLVFGSERSALCCQLASLEAATAIALALQRTLVLPRAGKLEVYFNFGQLRRLVPVVSFDTHEAARSRDCIRANGGIALCYIRVADGQSPWLEAEATPGCSRFVDDYLRGDAPEIEQALELDAPLRGAEAVRRRWGHLRQQVLLLDDCLGTVAPASILDAGQRALFSRALRPCSSVLGKVLAFLSTLPRPFVAVRADLACARAVAAELSNVTRKRPRAWVDASARADPPSLAFGVLLRRVRLDELVRDEDAIAQDVLRISLCALADYFVGAAQSLDSEWVRRLRVNGCARGGHSGQGLVDHTFVTRGAGGTALDTLGADERSAIERVQARAVPALYCRRARAASERCRWRHRVAVVDLDDWRATTPSAAWTPPPCSSAQELFEHFLVDRLPQLRQHRLHVAPAGSTCNVALIIEPRCHPALEHCVRNVAYHLGDQWQLQIFHGTANEAFVRELFAPSELARLQLVSLGVDNLSKAACFELLCSHWLWCRAAAERVLIFQTDSLACRRGVDEFQMYDYVGAPWKLDHAWSAGVPWLAHAGNGGFSLRSRSAALRTLDYVDYSRGEPDDLFFVEHVPRVGGQLAPREVAMRFAVESISSDAPFGFHKAYVYLPADEMRMLLSSISYAPPHRSSTREGGRHSTARQVWRGRPACVRERSHGSEAVVIPSSFDASAGRRGEASGGFCSVRTCNATTDRTTWPGSGEWPQLSPRIALTRRADMQDGFGAQLHRMLAVYCLCRELGFEYVHTPMVEVGNQGLVALADQRHTRQFVDDCNRLACLPHSADIRTLSAERELWTLIEQDLTVAELLQLKAAPRSSNVLVRYRCLEPPFAADLAPAMYAHARGLLAPELQAIVCGLQISSPPSPVAAGSLRTITIGVHVRRGDLAIGFAHLILPNCYYLTLTERVVAICEALRVPFVCELYTEALSKEARITPQHPGMQGRLSRAVTLPESERDLRAFERLPHLRRHVNEAPLVTFTRMVRSDVLIASRSGFSLCAHYLKVDGLTIFPSGWQGYRLDDGIACDAAELDVHIIRAVVRAAASGGAAGGVTSNQ